MSGYFYRSQGENGLKGKVMLLLIILVIAAGATYYLTVPQTTTALSISKLYNIYQEQTIKVNVSLLDVTDAIDFVVSLKWDPYILKVKTGDNISGWRDPLSTQTPIYYNIYEGPFFRSFSSTLFVINSVSNTKGEIKRIYEQLAVTNETGATGSGLVAIIEFECLNNGTTTIEITQSAVTRLLDVGTPLSTQHLAVNGSVTETGPPPIWTEQALQIQVLAVELTAMAATPVVISIVRSARAPKQSKSAMDKRIEKLFEEE